VCRQGNSMKIENILLAPGDGAFFYDDQAAIKRGAQQDGERYVGQPATHGFTSIRMPASTLSIGLVLDGGFVAWGDMMSVQYAAASGRDPVFEAGHHARLVTQHIAPWLVGRSARSFRQNAEAVCEIRAEDASLHSGIQYGITQALLAAAAHTNRCAMAEVICSEYGFPLKADAVPIFGQSGDERYRNVDKMILKRVDVLPHGLINSPEKFGANGEKFLEYVTWVTDRVVQLGAPDYSPTLHFDLYGMVGQAFDLSIDRIADYLGEIEKAASPLKARIEGPADFGSFDAHFDGFAKLRQQMRKNGCALEIVADEWCNTLADIEKFVDAGAADMVQIKMPDMGGIQNSIEAVRRCHDGGVGAYLGGSCCETDISARASVHVAVATQADMQLAKPGMGLDEGITIVRNEQSRLIAYLNSCGFSESKY